MDVDALPEQIARTRRFTSGAASGFTIGADGTVLFVRGRSGDDPVGRLWALDPGATEPRMIADPAAPPVPGPVRDPRPDPHGRWIAYARGGALRVVGADGAGDRAIAEPEGPDIAYGTATHTGLTDPGGADRGHWWAPDGTRLLIARTDVSGVELWHLADPTDPARPPRTIRYAAAGTANAEVTLWLAGLGGARVPVRWDRAAFEYLVGAGWDAHGPYAVVQGRDQSTVRFLAIGHDGTTTVLAEWHHPSWVHLVPGLPARTASGTVVAHADLGDTRYLTVSGAPVTPPGLQVRAVLGVEDEDVLFTASEDPEETHLWTVRAGAGARRLTTEPGVHTGVRRGGTLVRASGGRAVVTRAGAPPATIASLAERPVLDVHAVPLVLGARALRARLHLPSWHRPGVRLPVLVDAYGGAGRQRVTAEGDWRSAVAQWFAEQGFAVLVADGAGTPGRGPQWEREVHGDLYGPVLDDQVDAVREAARRHPDLDLGRVGIRGWSFGGSLAALAVLRRPDVFHAAVAGAPVTDQRLYDAHWRERFLGDPAAHPGRYDACSLVREAHHLTRPLLLMHGLADAKSHPAHTLRLSSALLAAGRPHDVRLIPGAGHQAIGSPATAAILHVQAGFLRRHLGL
ncbi:MAG TPA: prolyl oligopeptidase family serine peptidase [Streptosporangiaceae bacterium]|jgi:dipeptidyl-peptidase-4